jgi:heptaprenyl diphosphate synthase
MSPFIGLPVVVPDHELETAMREGLDHVEELMRETTKSDYPFVTEASRHLVDAGGKRFRALLTLLAARFGDPHAPGVVPAAAVVELTHLATLYHDDVMDEAPLRRGATSANVRWGNTVAILTGDFLFAKASELLADLGPEAVRLQAQTFERLCTGQIRETVGPADGEDAVAHHLQVLGDKTGSLIATSARFGAMLSGAPAPVAEAVARYGERIGVAFQLADDVVDIASQAGQSGKTPGTDLREGVRTYAVLQALATTDVESAELRELVSRPLTDEREHARALELLRSHAALELARAESRRWADEARDALSSLPVCPAREALEMLCDYVVDRTG